MTVSTTATVVFVSFVVAMMLGVFFMAVVFTATSATSVFAAAASASFAAHKVDHALDFVVSGRAGSYDTAFEV